MERLSEFGVSLSNDVVDFTTAKNWLDIHPALVDVLCRSLDLTNENELSSSDDDRS